MDELLIAATPQDLQPQKKARAESTTSRVIAEVSAPSSADKRQLAFSDELVTRAEQTRARVRFIESPVLLKEFGGVGAVLRFRI